MNINNFKITISMTFCPLSLVLSLVSSLTTEKKSYEDYKVLRVYPASAEDLDLLHSIGSPS